MLTLINWVMIAGAIVLLIPVVTLAVEIAAAIVLNEQTTIDDDSPRSRLAVIIPAHDEADGLLPTLADVRAQLKPGDRVLVVADNCSDNTAAIAHTAGAEVVERRDPERFGKGFALDYGLKHLKSDPPEIVVVVDADCRITAHTLDWLARSCKRTGRPAQALNQMKQANGDEAPEGQRVALFAWIIKAYVRPLGLATLGLPCQLMGTGMAFPWQAVRTVELGSGNLVEDLKLGLDLAANGLAPRFCSQACVTSTFPNSVSAQLAQRQRWEVGSLRTLIAEVPKYLSTAIMSRNVQLFVLALDALIPPLVVLAALLVFCLLATIVWALIFDATPFQIAVAALVLFVASIIAGWMAYGRTVLRASDVKELKNYFSHKIPIYRPASLRSSKWIRTDRK